MPKQPLQPTSSLSESTLLFMRVTSVGYSHQCMHWMRASVLDLQAVAINSQCPVASIDWQFIINAGLEVTAPLSTWVKHQAGCCVACSWRLAAVPSVALPFPSLFPSLLPSLLPVAFSLQACFGVQALLLWQMPHSHWKQLALLEEWSH